MHHEQEGCTQGGMVGVYPRWCIPWCITVYTSLYASLLYHTHHGTSYTPGYIPLLYTLGIPTIPLYSRCWSLHVLRCHVAQRGGPGLKEENSLRKRGSQAPRDLKSVIVMREMMRRVAPLLGVKEWIRLDRRRVNLRLFPMVGPCCALSLLLPAIRSLRECGAECASLIVTD